MDNPAEISIIGKNSMVVGKIKVNIVPIYIDEDGMETDVPEDLFPENPEELIDRRIDFIVEIDKA